MVIGYANTSFLATLDYDVGTPGDPIIFNVVPLNPGDCYDVTTGIYTVPLDGVYEFQLHIWSINDAACGAYIVIDEVLVSYDRTEETSFVVFLCY